MSQKRRTFLGQLVTGAVGVGIGFLLGKEKSANTVSQNTTSSKSKETFKDGLVISTWNHGLAANNEAWKIISDDGNALDAAEAGVKVSEADITGRSVGIGGTPDRDGIVTLDACIMPTFPTLF